MLDEKLLRNYHQRRVEDLAICRHSLAEGKFEEIVFVGHKLKGNGVMFGYPELSVIGEKLEKAAKEKSADEIILNLVDLEKWVQEKTKGP